MKSSKAHFDQLRFVVVSFKSDVHLQKDVTKVERNELIHVSCSHISEPEKIGKSKHIKCVHA